jgi:hypothetical protein
MKTNSDDLKVALLWKGGDHLEIYQRVGMNRHAALSAAVRHTLIVSYVRTHAACMCADAMRAE